MKLLERISRRAGLTVRELKVIIFITVALFTGVIINLIKDYGHGRELLEFDYSKEDSSFWSDEKSGVENPTSGKLQEKEVDSKRELLDFRGENSEKTLGDKRFSSVKLIDLNTASINELTSLPGIGIKTAEKIIEYRNSVAKFKTANDLLNVKGIGQAKLKKIKNLIIVK